MSKEAMKLALEALNVCEVDGYIPVRNTRDAIKALEEALSKQEHGCTRSHPHEEMSKGCKLRTEIARLTNQLANTKQEQCAEPTRPQQMTPEEALDWLAQQHFDQCQEERPIQNWIKGMKAMLPKDVL